MITYDLKHSGRADKTVQQSPKDPVALPGYFDWVGDPASRIKRIQRTFHTQLALWHRQVIPPGARVFEMGCAAGDLIAGLSPGYGVGVDLSERMIEAAQTRYALNQNLRFKCLNADDEFAADQFDYIVVSYLIGYLSDVEQALRNLRAVAHPRTRLVLTSLNHLWSWPLKWAQWVRLVAPQPQSNWLSSYDLVNLLELAGWEVVEQSSQQLMPFNIPLLTGFLNRFIVRLPFFRHFGITITLIARLRATPRLEGNVSCSVIVPMRNEAGNIRAALERIPVLGKKTEVILVEGNSADDTWATIQREVGRYYGPHVIQIMQQPGKGKWDAVRTGLAVATGDVVVIQDGDLTAPPEDLPKFYAAIAEGTAEFANGCRLVYPMETEAMRFLNFLGNKFFAMALTYVLGQPVKDSLCGTKMLLRSDYLRVVERIQELGNFDPFGDFNLLFGSALLRLRIRDIPVRYKDRTYGQTNISRFHHGWLLLKMTIFGLFRIRWK